MKKAVIFTGGKQYLVSEGQSLEVELLNGNNKKETFPAWLVIDGDKTNIGTPEVPGVTVTAEILEPIIKSEKVTAIRFKAKKRVKKVHGHRQKLTKIKISKIG